MKIYRQIKYSVLFAVVFFISVLNAYATNNMFELPPSSIQNQTQSLSIPLTLNNLSFLDIESIDLSIGYDPSVLTATGISLTGTVLNSQSYLYAFNTDISGIIYALFAASSNIYTRTGLLLNLEFTVIGTSGETSDITISQALFNNVPASRSHGIFTVAPNAPPTITGLSPQTMNEDDSHSTSFTLNDYETPACDIIPTFETSDPTILSINNISYTCLAGSITLTVTPSANQWGTVTLTVTATDTGGLTNSQSFELTVSPVNDAPILANSISNRIAIEGTAYEYTFPENTFIDADPGDTLTYSASQSNDSPLPSWLSFDPATRTFSGLPTNADNGVIMIKITATDTSMASISDTFELNVTNTNNPPVLDIPIADDSIQEDAAYSFTFDANTFSDSDVGDSISYTAMLTDNSPLPSWLTFDVINRNFSGTPLNEHVGTISILIIASDTSNLTATDTFNLTVENVNDSPLISSISDQSTNEDTVLGGISFTVIDEDGDSLMVTATSSNPNLVANENITIDGASSSRTITITPSSNEHGSTILTISASDGSITTTTTFTLTVASVNDAPTLSNIGSQNMDENSSLNVTVITADIDGDPLTITVSSSDQTLLPDSHISLSNDGDTYTITIQPTTAQVGSSEVTIEVDDGTETNATTFSVIVHEVHYTISGHVSSYTDVAGSSMAGVTMTLSGTHVYSQQTDASGNFAFTSVRPGDYTLTAAKTDPIDLELADAITILKATVKKTTLGCHEKIAADAYIDGYYGAYDAAKVAQYVVGTENCVNDDCLFWQFIPEAISSCDTWPLIEIENVRRYTDLSGDALDQNFIGIGCGNVSY